MGLQSKMSEWVEGDEEAAIHISLVGYDTMAKWLYGASEQNV